MKAMVFSPGSTGKIGSRATLYEGYGISPSFTGKIGKIGSRGTLYEDYGIFTR